MADRGHRPLESRAARLGRRIEDILLVGALAILIAVATAQIALRNGWSIGLSWADGLTRLAVLWLALIGAVAAVLDGRHITMAALTRWLPVLWRRGVAVVTETLAAAVCAGLGWQASRFVYDSYQYADTVMDGFPAWLVQAVMPVAFAIMAWRYLCSAVRHAKGP